MKIVADASALLAVFLDEPDAAQYLEKLEAAPSVSMSPVNWWEVQVCMRSRYGEAGRSTSQKLIEGLGIVVEPITHLHAEVAVEAWAKFGGRPARLNLGDCFAYALARVKKAPLLYKGPAFSLTGIDAA